MIRECRNSPDGWHHKGPADAKGRFLCINCGKPLVHIPDENLDDCCWFIVGLVIFLLVANIVIRYLYSPA